MNETSETPAVPPPLGKRLLRFPYDIVVDFIEDDGPTQAAALSFYALLSLAPLLLVVTELASWWLGTEAALAQLHTWTDRIVHGEAAGALHQLLDELGQQDLFGASGVWGWVGAAMTLFVATTLVVQLQTGLNQIWRVRPDPDRRSIVTFFLKRGLSLAILLSATVAVVASAVLGSLTRSTWAWLTGSVPDDPTAMLGGVGSNVIVWLVLAGTLAVAFYVLPDVRIHWGDAALGGGVTAAAVLLGSWALGWYLGVAAVGSAWGASGAVAVFLVWVYYTANIVLVGAELTRRWAMDFGGGVQPGRRAIQVRTTHLDNKKDAMA